MLLRRLSSAAPARQKSGAGILDLIAQLDAGGAITGGTYVSEAMALRQATVFTCVKIISESVASLPIGLYRKTPQHELVEVTDHPALELIARPNNWMTWHELCQYWVTHSELRGNAYAFKVRTGDGRVRELYPLRPDQVGVRQDYDWSLKYTVGAGKENVNGTYGPERVFHLRNFGTTGYVGESTIALARDEIGLGLQMQKHASNLFKNGTNIGTVFLHPKTLSDPAYQRLKESIDKNFSGPKNTGRPFIAEEGMTVEKLGMTLEDAQFLDSRRFSKQEIAGLFGVPMFLLNDTEKSTTWGSGLEHHRPRVPELLARPAPGPHLRHARARAAQRQGAARPRVRVRHRPDHARRLRVAHERLQDRDRGARHEAERGAPSREHESLPRRRRVSEHRAGS